MWAVDWYDTRWHWLTLNSVMATDACHLCSSWAACFTSCFFLFFALLGENKMWQRHTYERRCSVWFNRSLYSTVCCACNHTPEKTNHCSIVLRSVCNKWNVRLIRLRRSRRTRPNTITINDAVLRMACQRNLSNLLPVTHAVDVIAFLSLIFRSATACKPDAN